MRAFFLAIITVLIADVVCLKPELRSSFLQTIVIAGIEAQSIGLGFVKVINTSSPELISIITKANCELDTEYRLFSEPNDFYWPEIKSIFRSINAVKALHLSKLRKTLVAVVDTGLDTDHEDIKGRVNKKLAFNAENFLTGWDPSDSVVDTIGHGTHVSGIIAAKGFNQKGIVGVSKNSIIIPIKVTTDGTIFLSSILTAYAYISWLIDVGYPIKVINASFGGENFSDLEYQAIRELGRKGVIIVAAAGNYSSNLKTSPVYPANYGLRNIIAVASGFYDPKSKTAQISKFSNYGRNISIMAPGENVISLFPNNKYVMASGTSMAAPMVSGALAIYFGINPKAGYKEATLALAQSCLKVQKLKEFVNEGCYLNVNNLIKLAQHNRKKRQV